MAVINRIAEFHEDIKGWRRDLHAHPETAFEEVRTSDFVAEKLNEWGIEVHRGLATTGVVGVLHGSKKGGRAIGLRADMDALHLTELNEFDHRSTNEGKMHGCGHDGHTAMLLGAARYLAETKNFDGTVNFIFQPAEENEGGGRVMVEEGLFDKFPVEAVYGLHNMPGIPTGQVGMRVGPAMAAFDIFEVTVEGVGAHAAMPHLGVDAILVTSQIVTALQSIASRRVDPLESVVVSVTQVHAGDTWNVIPQEAVIRGTVRSFNADIQAQTEVDIERIAKGICESQGASMKMRYERRYPAVVNTSLETDIAAEVAAQVVGDNNVEVGMPPLMGSEDFAYMLQKKPGCYIWLGNGADGQPGGCSVHNPLYDFNDEISVIGASYWAKLVETTLPRAG
ncbi:M20 aminoacylase family protein [Pelagibius sp. Alg239-R121]|uniref:M20 aminoacylase family protein n=1 Tax=Pelagibius sp. Alg239-R121 TaxID=2993448 RepID=UPI0024A6FDD3|nr:M20 aminoacylase family protein [Pelagibius sp. Alg239-R121]